MTQRTDFPLLTNLGNVANPTQNTDAANKQYVDAQTSTGGFTFDSASFTNASIPQGNIVLQTAIAAGASLTSVRVTAGTGSGADIGTLIGDFGIAQLWNLAGSAVLFTSSSGGADPDDFVMNLSPAVTFPTAVPVGAQLRLATITYTPVKDLALAGGLTGAIENNAQGRPTLTITGGAGASNLINIGTGYVGDNSGILVKVLSSTPTLAAVTGSIQSIADFGLVSITSTWPPTIPAGFNTRFVAISSANNSDWAGVGAIADPGPGIEAIAWIKKPSATGAFTGANVWAVANMVAGTFSGTSVADSQTRPPVTALIFPELTHTLSSDQLGGVADSITVSPLIASLVGSVSDPVVPTNVNVLGIGPGQSFTIEGQTIGPTLIGKYLWRASTAQNNRGISLQVLSGANSGANYNLVVSDNIVTAGMGGTGALTWYVTNTLTSNTYQFRPLPQAAINVDIANTIGSVPNPSGITTNYTQVVGAASGASGWVTGATASTIVFTGATSYLAIKNALVAIGYTENPSGIWTPPAGKNVYAASAAQPSYANVLITQVSGTASLNNVSITGTFNVLMPGGSSQPLYLLDDSVFTFQSPPQTEIVRLSNINNVSSLNTLKGDVALLPGTNIGLVTAGQNITINSTSAGISASNFTSFVTSGGENAYAGITGFVTTNVPNFQKACFGFGLQADDSTIDGGYIGPVQYINTTQTAVNPYGFAMLFPVATTYTTLEVLVYSPNYTFNFTATGASGPGVFTLDNVLFSKASSSAASPPDLAANIFPGFAATSPGSDDVQLNALLDSYVTVTDQGGGNYRAVVTGGIYSGIINNYTHATATTTIPYLGWQRLLVPAGVSITGISNLTLDPVIVGGVRCLVALPGQGGATPTLQQVMSTGNSTNLPIVFQDSATTPKAVTLGVPAAINTSYSLKLPDRQGTANQTLSNDGSGNLSWQDNKIQVWDFNEFQINSTAFQTNGIRWPLTGYNGGLPTATDFPTGIQITWIDAGVQQIFTVTGAPVDSGGYRTFPLNGTPTNGVVGARIYAGLKTTNDIIFGDSLALTLSPTGFPTGVSIDLDFAGAVNNSYLFNSGNLLLGNGELFHDTTNQRASALAPIGANNIARLADVSSYNTPTPVSTAFVTSANLAIGVTSITITGDATATFTVGTYIAFASGATTNRYRVTASAFATGITTLTISSSLVVAVASGTTCYRDPNTIVGTISTLQLGNNLTGTYDAGNLRIDATGGGGGTANPPIWLTGSGTPADALGVIGNYYQDTSATPNFVWLKTQTTTSPFWVRQPNLENAIRSYTGGVLSFSFARVVATSNLTLSGTPVIDGITVAVGNVVLAAGQTLSQNNGLYTVASGAWTRVSSPVIVQGLVAVISLGTSNAGNSFIQSAPITTVGTDNQTWTIFAQNGASSLQATCAIGRSVNAASSNITLFNDFVTPLQFTGNSGVISIGNANAGIAFGNTTTGVLTLGTTSTAVTTNKAGTLQATIANAPTIGVQAQDFSFAINLKGPATLAADRNYTLNLQTFPLIAGTPLVCDTSGGIGFAAAMNIGNTASDNLQLVPGGITRTGTGALTILAGTGASAYVELGSGNTTNINHLQVFPAASGSPTLVRATGDASGNTSLSLQPSGSGEVRIGNLGGNTGFIVQGGQTAYSGLQASGVGTDLDIQLITKGSGVVKIQNGASNSFTMTPITNTTLYNVFNFGGSEARFASTAAAGFTIGNLNADGTIAQNALNIRSIAGGTRIRNVNTSATAVTNLILEGNFTGSTIQLGTDNQIVSFGPSTTTTFNTQLNAGNQINGPGSLTAGVNGQALYSRGNNATPAWSFAGAEGLWTLNSVTGNSGGFTFTNTQVTEVYNNLGVSYGASGIALPTGTYEVTFYIGFAYGTATTNSFFTSGLGTGIGGTLANGSNVLASSLIFGSGNGFSSGDTQTASAFGRINGGATYVAWCYRNAPTAGNTTFNGGSFKIRRVSA